MLNLRRAARVGQVREWTTLLHALRRIEGPATLVILATGIYLGATHWGFQLWIGVGVMGLVAMAVLGIALRVRRTIAIVKSMSAGDEAPAARRRLVEEPAPRRRV